MVLQGVLALAFSRDPVAFVFGLCGHPCDRALFGPFLRALGALALPSRALFPATARDVFASDCPNDQLPFSLAPLLSSLDLPVYSPSCFDHFPSPFVRHLGHLFESSQVLAHAARVQKIVHAVRAQKIALAARVQKIALAVRAQKIVHADRVQTIVHADFFRARAALVVPELLPLAPVAEARASAQASDTARASESALETESSHLAFQTEVLLEYMED